MPRPWHCMSIVAGWRDPTDRLFEAFPFARASSPNARELAVFFRDEGGGLYTLFFPPSAETLARTFGAAPCDKPDADDIGVSIGDPVSLRSWFPKPSGARAA
ncbi:MAG TPA: hypothetical protein VMU47_01980 [Caldimonas sp.]|nr:hypothetical protein [Caldimonas sp.]